MHDGILFSHYIRLLQVQPQAFQGYISPEIGHSINLQQNKDVQVRAWCTYSYISPTHTKPKS